MLHKEEVKGPQKTKQHQNKKGRKVRKREKRKHTTQKEE